MAIQSPKVSVIIPNYNGFVLLKRCLLSIQRVSYPNLEVIVFDNHSTTDDVANIKSFFPKVKVVAFSSNLGFTRGYNQILKDHRSKYVFLVNNDTILTPNLVKLLVTYAENHPDVAIIQPKVKSQTLTSHFEYAGAAGGFVDCLGYPYCRGRILFAVEADHGQYDTTADIFWASGTAMFCRTRIIQEVGLFDNDLFVYAEEHDLCWRVLKHGVRIVCLPHAVIYHKGQGYFGNHLFHKVFLIHRNHLLVLVKHLPLLNLIWILPLRIVLDYMAAMYYIYRGFPTCAPAVVAAHVDFLRLLPKFWKKRRGNYPNYHDRLSKLIYPKSILFEYFFRKKRKFSQLYPEQTK